MWRCLLCQIGHHDDHHDHERCREEDDGLHDHA
jgi:hypothetical protein